MQHIFDNEYKGPRWTYGLQCRPLARWNVPDGWIIHSERKHSKFIFGTVDYPFELSSKQTEQFQLKLVNGSVEYDIWLNENEDAGRLACGCAIGYKDGGAYFKMCQFHRVAEKMMKALKFINEPSGYEDEDPNNMLHDILCETEKALSAIKRNPVIDVQEDEIQKPKVIINLSGGLPRQIIATTDIDVEIIDYDDLEGDGHNVVEIEGRRAYVYQGVCVDIEPAKARRICNVIDCHRSDETQLDDLK